MTGLHEVRAFCYALAVETGLKWVSLRRLSTWLGVGLESSGARSAGELAAATAVREVIAATDRALALWPSQGRCLRRSLVMGALLRTHRPTLRIGVRRDQLGLTAHAWIEIDGNPVGECVGEEYRVLS